MWTGSPRRRQVIQRNQSAPQAPAGRRTRPALILAAVVAVLSMSLAIAPSASASGAAGWGENYVAELGNGTNSGSGGCELCDPTPGAVSGLSEVTAVAAGRYHGLALLAGGTVMAWGANGFGQLGDGTTTGPEICKAPTAEPPCSRVPIAVSGLSEAGGIAAGESFSLALLKNGTVMAWGSRPESDVPVPVSGLSEVVAIAAGAQHALALLKNGTVMAWGANGSGQLGDGTTTTSNVPVPVSGLKEVAAVAAGDFFSLALLKNGTVMAWGANGSGELGDGTNTGPETCEEVLSKWGCSRTPVPVSGLSEVTAVAGSSGSGFGPNEGHSLAVLKGGGVEAWGRNAAGQLGDGTETGPEKCKIELSEEFPCARTPVPVSGLTEATAVSAGGFFSLALRKGGTISSWGYNAQGQLGNGTRTSSDVPLAVPGPLNVSAVSAGADFALAVGVVPPIPTITKVEPNHGPPTGGTSVTITGTNFTGATAVKFGSTNATSFTVNSATSITAVSPAGTGAVDVTVTTTAGGTSAITPADQFNYGPVVTKIEPSFGRGPGGTSVTITGTNFTGATAVKFGSTAATSFTVNSESSITAVSPAGTGLVDVTVTAPGGTSATGPGDRFDYRPSVSRVAPINGLEAGGTTVEIVGANFNEVNAVKFGSTNATSFTVNSEGLITAVSPAGTGTVDVTVTTSGGTSETSAADKFSYAAFFAHYYSNGAKLKESNGVFGEAGVKEVIGWGTIRLQGTQGGAAITCHSVVAGDVWNPVGGRPGKSKTQAWAVFDCETNMCAEKTVVNVVPENLPWPGELVGGGLAKTNTIRALSEGVKVDVTCNALSAAHFKGSYEPGAPAGEDKGTSPAHPGFIEFDQPGSGTLEEVELAGSDAPTGSVRELGYGEQELIQAK